MEKAQKVIFILLLIFLPSQLGLHFWPSWAYINGIRIDYFSLTLYFTDILIGILVMLNLPALGRGLGFQHLSRMRAPRQAGRSRNEFGMTPKTILLLGPQRLARTASALALIVLFVLFNIYFSYTPFVSLYKWLKVAEFGFLAWWIAKNAHHSIKLEHVTVMLLIPVVYESILAIWQFFGQSSIGGLWYFLGERSFNSSTPGIANAFINGSLVMRPYGTFSHPNVLGGFMLVSLLIILCYPPSSALDGLRRDSASQLRFPRISRKITAAVLVLGTAGLFLSLSRTAIFAGLISSVFFLKKKVLVLLLLLALLFLLPRFTSLLVETEPVVAREQLNNLAIQQWKQSPIFGTGLGTSPLYYSMNHELGIRNYALIAQPTHNIYLLILSETGIVGLVLFGLFVLILIKHSKGIIRASLFTILLIGLFDHYFLTLQQGQLLLSIVMGLTSMASVLK